jgi:putative membrane protein
MSSRDVGIVALVVIGVLILLPLLGGLGMTGGWGMMGPGMMGGQWSGDWWGGLGMPFLGGLFWMLILAGIVLVIVSLARREATLPLIASEPPLEILKRRLARGEITREEYEAIKKEIS